MVDSEEQIRGEILIYDLFDKLSLSGLIIKAFFIQKIMEADIRIIYKVLSAASILVLIAIFYLSYRYKMRVIGKLIEGKKLKS